MLENAKKISDDFSAAGQASAEDLQQAAQAGFKSVLNLRSRLGLIEAEQMVEQTHERIIPTEL